jgi:peptidoglycan hydrolase CwlO-like protein
LETEVNNLEKNQTQIEQTLGNLNNALRDAQAKHQTAENNLTITNEKLTAKQQNIQETEGLIANKQQEIEAKQAEHAAKQGIA